MNKKEKNFFNVKNSNTVKVINNYIIIIDK